ncbi:MAG TPA: PD-(D/E)XK nuclease family protein [Saprospiraceae bacterium]|nr:PD-(D/E)XK nuclease family protein [Saprospiraceae bacterium]HMQ82169.1 PD-(D/E)XK nuclease family protein [Saprospiraceae bacterium]
MYTIYFGLEFDSGCLPLPEHSTGGTHYVGPNGLLRFLEIHLGLPGYSSNDEYLRIEQYRQALLRHEQSSDQPFYRASFQADQFATATFLLSKRDELLLAGWDFAIATTLPERLGILAEIENYFQPASSEAAPLLKLLPGFSDRIKTIVQYLAMRQLPPLQLYFYEPEQLLPIGIKRLLQQLKKVGVPLMPWPDSESNGHSDLDHFRHVLQSRKAKKYALQGDGSLLILKGRQETELAAFTACLLKQNPEFRPIGIVPASNIALENALIQEGLPALGIASASLARPTLQVLKLVPVFLWEPIDPYKIMEFVSLSVKPLEKELANRIAALMAQTPGLNSEAWNVMIARYFDELPQRAAFDKSLQIEKIRHQYQFWFTRRRYDISQVVPKEEVLDIFDFLARWAVEGFEETGSKNTSLLVLSEQAKRIVALLEALPEEWLSALDVERIVRTIYEGSPVQLRQEELGHLPFVSSSGAIMEPVDAILWWNFIQQESENFFSFWYPAEIQWLKLKGIVLDTPQKKNQLQLWQRIRPIVQCRQRLILVVPEMVDGRWVNPHPLTGDLQAIFDDLSSITIDIKDQQNTQQQSTRFKWPTYQPLEKIALGQVKAFLKVHPRWGLSLNEEETFSSLQDLLYYPYQWVFRHKLKLKKSFILSIVKDETMLGNLAHRVFEKLLKEAGSNWNQQRVFQYVEQEIQRLFTREGAVLLMYGKEPERVHFVQNIKHAAWSLLRHIYDNNWEVADTELPLSGALEAVQLNGRADLVLQRGDERAVVDLKWRGSNYRSQLIKSEEDLQLVLYSYLLEPREKWAHTAFFIMQKGQMLTRNALAFKEATTISPDDDHEAIQERILNRILATSQWREQQLTTGLIEVRCQHTAFELEEAYQEVALLEMLEMKSGNAPFDDYQTLVNLIE